MFVPHLHTRGLTEEQLNELKKEINKTEYEKTIEPYQEEINSLNLKMGNMKKDMIALYKACENIIRSMDKDYIEILVDKDKHKPKAYFTNSINTLPLTDFEEIKIAVKEDLINDFRTNLQYFRRKIEEENN